MSNPIPELPIGIERIAEMLPHRYPFLLVDRVTAIEPGKRLSGYKCVSFNEPFFQGHFPGHPVMPGVLVIEAMAQAAGLLTQLSRSAEEIASQQRKVFYLVKVDKAKFSDTVVPGDRLELEVELTRTIRNIAMYSCCARVDGKQVACADIVCAENSGQ